MLLAAQQAAAAPVGRSSGRRQAPPSTACASRVPASLSPRHSARRQARQAARAAAAAEQQQQSPRLLLEDAQQGQALLAALSATSSYGQLAALVRSQPGLLLRSPLVVYALLHAVALRDTIADDRLGTGSLASEDAVLSQLALVDELLEELCDAAVEQLPQLPLSTQATLALALAQLEYHHAPLYTAVADAALPALQQAPLPGATAAAGAGAGEQQQQQQDCGGIEALPPQLVPGVLLSLAMGFSLNGHYEPALMEALAAQAVARRAAFGDPGLLISIAAALLDVQHHCPALLQAAADAVAASSGTGAAPQQQQSSETGSGSSSASSASSSAALGADEVVSLLLGLGFFRVPPGQRSFVDDVLQALAAEADALAELEPRSLGVLWKALLLLAADGGAAPPPELAQVLAAAAADEPQLLLLGGCRAALEVDDLEAVQAADEGLRAQWEAAGLLAPAQILAAIRDMGFELEQGVLAPWPAGLQQQQQQQVLSAMPPATVDLCLQLPDGRRLAVMVLDEGRYCNSPPGRLRGAAAVDVRVLQALGLLVLPLPLAEWQALGGQAEQQLRYLRARLAAATA